MHYGFAITTIFLDDILEYQIVRVKRVFDVQDPESAQSLQAVMPDAFRISEKPPIFIDVMDSVYGSDIATLFDIQSQEFHPTCFEDHIIDKQIPFVPPKKIQAQHEHSYIIQGRVYDEMPTHQSAHESSLLINQPASFYHST